MLQASGELRRPTWGSSEPRLVGWRRCVVRHRSAEAWAKLWAMEAKSHSCAERGGVFRMTRVLLHGSSPASCFFSRQVAVSRVVGRSSGGLVVSEHFSKRYSQLPGELRLLAGGEQRIARALPAVCHEDIGVLSEGLEVIAGIGCCGSSIGGHSEQVLEQSLCTRRSCGFAEVACCSFNSRLRQDEVQTLLP